MNIFINLKHFYATLSHTHNRDIAYMTNVE